MGIFSNLFGKNKQLQEFIEKDAIILDVRTKVEFAGGAIKGSKNIPVQQLPQRLSEVKKWNKPVIACCASGMRSSKAASILNQNGIEAINGGGWSSLQSKL